MERAAIVVGMCLLMTSPGCGSWNGTEPESFGVCEDPIQSEWLDDGRKMKLLADYTYIGPDEVRWIAPAGSEVDGASIPQILWSVVGGPLEGNYRNASVVHDVACDKVEAIERLTAATLRQRVPTLPHSAPRRDLALPRLQRTLRDRGGPGIQRSGAQPGELEVLAQGTADSLRTKCELLAARVAAQAGVALDAKQLRARISRENDPAKRKQLAAQLLTLNRELSALHRVDVRVRVQGNPP